MVVLYGCIKYDRGSDILTLFPQQSDTVLLSVVNCLAVIYIYNQFSKLRKAGSKYILGQYTHTM